METGTRDSISTIKMTALVLRLIPAFGWEYWASSLPECTGNAGTPDPWLESTFEFPMDRFVDLWVFWIGLTLVLGMAHSPEGYPLATFGFQCSGTKTLRARLIEWIFAALAAAVIAIVIISFSGFVRSL